MEVDIFSSQSTFDEVMSDQNTVIITPHDTIDFVESLEDHEKVTYGSAAIVLLNEETTDKRLFEFMRLKV